MLHASFGKKTTPFPLFGGQLGSNFLGIKKLAGGNWLQERSIVDSSHLKTLRLRPQWWYLGCGPLPVTVVHEGFLESPRCGGNSNIFLFSPGEMIQFDEHIFQLGGVPTSRLHGWLLWFHSVFYGDPEIRINGCFEGSPKRWDRWHSPSPNWQEKYHLYTTYILPSVGIICYLPPFRGTRNNHWSGIFFSWDVLERNPVRRNFTHHFLGCWGYSLGLIFFLGCFGKTFCRYVTIRSGASYSYFLATSWVKTIVKTCKNYIFHRENSQEFARLPCLAGLCRIDFFHFHTPNFPSTPPGQCAFVPEVLRRTRAATTPAASYGIPGHLGQNFIRTKPFFPQISTL